MQGSAAEPYEKGIKIGIIGPQEMITGIIPYKLAIQQLKTNIPIPLNI